MNQRRQATNQELRASRRWLILVAIAGLLTASLGCSLAPNARLTKKLVGPEVLAAGPGDLGLATRTPWPTFTPIALPSPTPTSTPSPTPTPAPTDTVAPTTAPSPSSTPVPTSTPISVPTATSTPRPLPTATPWPTPTLAPAAVLPTATPAPTPTPTPEFAYLVNEVYTDYTANAFLTGYVAVVNAQEIPIGGVKAVGVFEPGGWRYETALSKWFFEGHTAPGAVMKSSSVKFEPPGGIQDGTWTIHLEDESGTRLSEDVAITTRSAQPEWFFVKFRQPGPLVSAARAPTPSSAWTRGGTTATPGSSNTPSSDWSFVSVQAVRSSDEATVILYGDMINDTGSAQKIVKLTGDFYDQQGRKLYYSRDRRPVAIAPPGGRIPFELTVINTQSVQNYSFRVVSQATSQTPRQDFEFSDLNTSDGGGDYCVVGELRNPGGELQEYLVIVAVLYNDQDNVINFDSDEDYSPQDVVGDHTTDFEICADTHQQQVTRYEVRAWGY